MFIQGPCLVQKIKTNSSFKMKQNVISVAFFTRGPVSRKADQLRTVPTIVTAHTYCASRGGAY